ncbi:hypothetical protein EYY60_21340 [Flavobacterium zhairuonense]|uniref:hypothetical protein n=1 Tax=Flavobacterium zhairuonense TaxID=2493631 RepID=UPI00104F4925|nr:hypothetical protein [Flavobacterium zhairuonense]KAF2507055.1 hypothetical protein EYY60_21340 [Flavobacterium zhairuonense]
MEKSDYLNLKMGNIEQYSMIIKKKDLNYWKRLNWKEYSEINQEKIDKNSELLFGLLKNRMETLIFSKPILLKEVRRNKFIGRKITEINTHLGTYGLDSTCFFGLLLDNEEYLVYSVWYANNYVLVNDRIVGCSQDCYEKMKPWISDSSNLVWDELTEYMIGSTIADYTFEDHELKLLLKKGKERIEVKFVRNDEKIPRKMGKFRNAYKTGKIDDYIVFQDKNGTLIV